MVYLPIQLLFNKLILVMVVNGRDESATNYLVRILQVDIFDL